MVVERIERLLPAEVNLLREMSHGESRTGRADPRLADLMPGGHLVLTMTDGRALDCTEPYVGAPSVVVVATTVPLPLLKKAVKVAARTMGTR